MRLSTRSGHKWLTASFFLSFVLTTALAAGLFSPKTAHAASTFTNPISSTADPFITYYRGIYYLTGDAGGKPVVVSGEKPPLPECGEDEESCATHRKHAKSVPPLQRFQSRASDTTVV